MKITIDDSFTGSEIIPAMKPMSVTDTFAVNNARNIDIVTFQKAEAKMLEVKKRTEEATADLRELQYWTEIANTIINIVTGKQIGRAHV